MSAFHWDEVTPWIDPEGCTDCGECLFVCPVDAIKSVSAGTVSVGDQSWYTPGRKRIEVDECIECAACVPECPYEAIYVVSGGSGGSVPNGPVNGGGGGGVSNPNVINNFVLDKQTQEKYPRFTTMIKNLENFVKTDTKVMNALKQWSGYTESQILDKLKFGQGPTIVVKDLTGKFGYFDRTENPNVINVDASWVRGLEAANLLETQQATGFLLAVTVLHEFVHQARAANGLDRNYEYGFGFEKSAFGMRIEDDGVAPYNYRFRLYKK